MPVTDILAAISAAIDIGLSAIQLSLFKYLINGGWVTILRSLGFFIDKTLISIITKGFEYFELIISKELFAPSLINSLTKNVYFFIAVFVLFKLAIRFMKYIMEPDLVSDQNIGTNAIIKRTIVGMCLILFIPSIFGLIRDLQKAIIADDIVNKIIMDKPTQAKYEDVKNRAPVGRIIGYSVLRGFINYDDEKFASSLVKKQWNTAETNFDPSGIDINAGGVGYIDNYFYDYIPIISTVALCYVAWLVIKYCFDVLIRFFKLTILQIISPIVMVDYIFEGGDQGTFKQWTTTVISTFAMLFIRILSLSLIIMVCIHMQMSQQDCINNYANSNSTQTAQEDKIACENSLLYVDKNGDVDNLLRAGIIIALLAFSMDLPKLFSQIFGLDLEQASSVTGMVQKVGGVAKMVGLGGLAFGGGLIGGALGGAKSALSIGANWGSKNKAIQGQKSDLAQQLKDGKITQSEYNKRMANLNSAATKNNYRAAGQLSATTRGMAFGGLMAAAGRTEVGSAATSGYQNSRQAATSGAGVKESQGLLGAYYDTKEAEEEKTKQDALESATVAYREHQMKVADAQLEQQQNINIKLGVNKNIDSVDVVSRAQGLSDFAKNDTVLGNLQSMNQTMDVTRDTVVNINDNVQTVVNTTNDISKNVKTAINTTQSIAQNTDTIVNQNEHISHRIDQIEDNTFYSGISAIEELDLNSYNYKKSNDTIGGISVSKPDPLSGERTTDSGIILNSSVEVDKKN